MNTTYLQSNYDDWDVCPECGFKAANKQSFISHYSHSHTTPYPWRESENTLWETVLERDDYTCRRCEKTPPADQLEVHHLIPTEVGGTDDLENLLALCKECHKEVHKKSYAEIIKEHPQIMDGLKEVVCSTEDD